MHEEEQGCKRWKSKCSLHGKKSKLPFFPCKLHSSSSSSGSPAKARSAKEEQVLRGPSPSEGPIFERSQGWSPVLGSVYTRVTPGRPCPPKHAEHGGVRMTEMEHDMRL